MLKILHLSTSDLDGGAARAAYRLHRGLRGDGVESEMLVRARDSLDPTIYAEKSLVTKLGPNANSIPLRSYPQRQKLMFSPQWFPDVLAKKIKAIHPEILHLHWICNGFLRIETLRSLRHFPLVWTIHDMWPFTGGCHYTEECDRYLKGCGQCPQLNSHKKQDLSYKVWQRKLKAWKSLKLTIVSPSQWLAGCAQASPLFNDRPIHVIPHGLDLTLYQPIDRSLARKLLKLPADRKIVLFGSSPGTTGDSRKGLHLLQPALQVLIESGWENQLELAIFGDQGSKAATTYGFKTHYLGQFKDDISLALVYSAADVMVVPSLQEAFGQTASEALACGTPVVAFAATGLLDIVTHQQDGYLATPFDPQSIAQGIAWILEDGDRYAQLRDHARQKALTEFSLETQVNRYRSLYRSILENLRP